MIINMDQVKLVLINKDIPANFLERQTGVSRSAITRVRNGERKLENLTLETIIKIQSWIDNALINDIEWDDYYTWFKDK